jgi:SAM-dependent methyltransferase
MKKSEIKKMVRKGYAEIAKNERLGTASSCSCCGSAGKADNISRRIGYKDEELQSVPEGANLGLGCGNPIAMASLRKGETLLDLGSGAGIDCFLAANKVGRTGRAVGVDMTPEMVERARKNAEDGKYRNVEFRLGEIENLPVADNSVDVVVSNCVINLSTDKPKVFRETFRVLRPGGRLMVSDIVLLKELPAAIKSSVEAYVGCLSGAMLKSKYINAIKAAGFREVKILDETSFPTDFMINGPTTKTIVGKLGITHDKIKAIGNAVRSVKVYGVKPN